MLQINKGIKLQGKVKDPRAKSRNVRSGEVRRCTLIRDI